MLKQVSKIDAVATFVNDRRGFVVPHLLSLFISLREYAPLASGFHVRSSRGFTISDVGVGVGVGVGVCVWGALVSWQLHIARR